MSSRYPQIDISNLKTESIQTRNSKVRVEDFAHPLDSGASFSDFIESLPDIFAGKFIRQVIQRIVDAKTSGKPVVFAMGAHVIKCGLSPVVIDLIRRGVITCVALNGAGTIHDSEIAFWGRTSEDVVEGMHTGLFGMAKETAGFINESAVIAHTQQSGLGETIGKRILENGAEYADKSILAAAYECGVPVTVHVCVGCDIVHMHPNADGEAIGDASLRDFRILTQVLSDIGNGGVLMNVGSAVVLPEVILKAVTTLINLGYDMKGIFGVNLDFMQQYRSNQQVVARIKEIGGDGIALTGHHEIMIPLIAAGISQKLVNRA
jgi:deoxyhypusine synthase